MDTHLPEGEYEGVFIGSERRTTAWKREQWLVVAQLVPPVEPLEIAWWLSIPDVAPGRRVSRRTNLAHAWIMATDERPDRFLHKRDPMEYLGDALWLFEVVEVRKDHRGHPIPAGARYSRVDRLVKKIVGSTPRDRGKQGA